MKWIIINKKNQSVKIFWRNVKNKKQIMINYFETMYCEKCGNQWIVGLEICIVITVIFQVLWKKKKKKHSLFLTIENYSLLIKQ